LAIRSNFWRCSIRLMVMNSIIIPSSSPKSSNFLSRLSSAPTLLNWFPTSLHYCKVWIKLRHLSNSEICNNRRS
jgi:hypothetical protein